MHQDPYAPPHKVWCHCTAKLNDADIKVVDDEAEDLLIDMTVKVTDGAGLVAEEPGVQPKL
jgi:hypothetical protein